jgi:Family of unknown function (DUF6428)
MLALAKCCSEPALVSPAEVSLGALLTALRAHPEKQLVFSYGGRDVLPGYHVTEIKSGRFESLDCGAAPEAWRETFIQLWDVPEKGRTHMKVEKFLAILRKVDERLPLDEDAKLTFEVSDGASAVQLYKVERWADGEADVRVALTQRASSCKPRDRWLKEKNVEPAACAPSKTKAACCG